MENKRDCELKCFAAPNNTAVIEFRSSKTFPQNTVHTCHHIKLIWPMAFVGNPHDDDDSLPG